MAGEPAGWAGDLYERSSAGKPPSRPHALHRSTLFDGWDRGAAREHEQHLCQCGEIHWFWQVSLVPGFEGSGSIPL